MGLFSIESLRRDGFRIIKWGCRGLFEGLFHGFLRQKRGKSQNRLHIDQMPINRQEFSLDYHLDSKTEVGIWTTIKFGNGKVLSHCANVGDLTRSTYKSETDSDRNMR